MLSHLTSTCRTQIYFSVTEKREKEEGGRKRKEKEQKEEDQLLLGPVIAGWFLNWLLSRW